MAYADHPTNEHDEAIKKAELELERHRFDKTLDESRESRAHGRRFLRWMGWFLAGSITITVCAFVWLKVILV